jgi:hypothetical protein
MARQRSFMFAALTMAAVPGLHTAYEQAHRKTDATRHIGSPRTDVCEVQLGVLGIPVTMRGEIRFHFEKTGHVVRVVTSSYRVTDRSAAENDARLDLKMFVWDNAAGNGAGTGIETVQSPWPVIQDGKWHALPMNIGRDAGFDVKRARFGARFTFDLASFERSCWADRMISTY